MTDLNVVLAMPGAKFSPVINWIKNWVLISSFKNDRWDNYFFFFNRPVITFTLTNDKFSQKPRTFSVFPHKTEYFKKIFLVLFLINGVNLTQAFARALEAVIYFEMRF